MNNTASPEQVKRNVALGKRLYEERVRQMLTPEDHGKFIAIDIHSGEYEIDDSEVTAVFRLRNRLPNAHSFIMREGYETAWCM